MENKNNFSLIILLFTLLSFLTVNSQDFKWARQIKGISYDYDDHANEMELDKDGNTYVFGETESYLFDIDPTVEGVQIINNSNIQNFGGLYLIKLDKNGKYLWGKTFGNYKRGGDYTHGIKIDKDGNLNILASISELDSSKNIVNSFITIMKLKPDGGLISTKKIPKIFGYGSSLNAYSFDLDNQNNIFLTGDFIGSIELDATNPSMNLTATGIDNYILKINNTGNFEWIKAFDNVEGSIAYSKVIVGKDGNLNLLNGASLYKLNSADKSIIWQRDFTNQNTEAFHITENNIILMNYKSVYGAIVDVDPSPTATVNVLENNFILFLNLDGDFLDVKQFTKPDNGNFMFYSAAEDYNGNFIFAGSFKGKVNFDSSTPTSFNLTAIGDYGEGFYLKLDANRNFVNAFKIGHETPQLSAYNNCSLFRIKRIKLLNNDTYLVGDFMWTCDFDPSITKQYTLGTINSSTINSDGFVLKLGTCEINKPYGEPDQSFCSVNATIADLKPNSSDIKWYGSLSSTTPLLKTALLVDGSVYYATQQNDNCPESIDRLAVTSHINQPPNAPVIFNSSFCENENATLNNIQVSGQNLKWYSSNIAAGTLQNNTLLENNTTYYVSQTIGCESDRTPILVRVYDIPLPTGNATKQFCIDKNATLASIGIIGTNLKWYDSGVNGLSLPETTVLQNATYYATQTENNCESERLAVTVKIQDTQIPIADSPQKFCIQKKASINDIDITGQNIKWYESTASEVTLSESTLLENGIIYYASQTISSCESDRIPITIQILEATTGDCINLVDELPYPKFFTPNNDNYNDTWTIDFAYLAPRTKIKIFDRYGKLIKELYEDDTWDGNYLRQQQPASDYWFIVTLLNGTEFRGHFSLKR